MNSSLDQFVMTENIHIAGTEHLGEVNCESLTVSGALTVEKGVQANEVNISGSAIVEGHVVTEVLSVSGSLRISGNLDCDDATISGLVKSEGSATIESMVLSGEVDLCDFESKEVVGSEGFRFENITSDVFRFGRNKEVLE